MSYEILYDKQFIKIGDKFLPMLLSGANNCYEANGVRERTWFNYKHILRASADNYCGSANELIKAANMDIADGEKNGYFEIFDNGRGGLSPKQYLNMIKNGIKKALTIEQLGQQGVFLKVGFSSNRTIRVHSSFELEMLMQLDEGQLCRFWFNTDARGVVKLRQVFFPRKVAQKIKKEFASFFVVKSVKTGGYVVRGVKNGYRYTFGHPYFANCFYGSALAEKYADTLSKRYGDDFEVVEINQAKEFMVPA